MKCTSCGSEVTGGKKFCNKCGSPMAAENQSRGSSPAAGTFRPPGWESTAPKQIKKSAPPQNIPALKKPSINIDKVQQNWTPPPGSAPVQDSEIFTPQTGTSGPASKSTRLFGSFKNIIEPVAEKIMGLRTSGKKPGLPIIAGGIIAVLLAIIIISRISCSGAQKTTTSSGYLPPDIQVMNEQITDNTEETKIETFVVVSNSVQKDEISKQLTRIYEFQKNRTGFSSKKLPTTVSVYAYSSRNIYTTDKDWWLGKLLWIADSEPQISINLDALLPRQEEIGYGGLTKDEYLQQVDTSSDSIISIMNTMRSNFRDFEKLKMSESLFKEQSEKLSDDLYDLSQKLPEPPVNDCTDLNKAFLSLVEASVYFQDLFAPDSDIFIDTRLDTEEFYSKLNTFATAQGVYTAERKKYE